MKMSIGSTVVMMCEAMNLDASHIIGESIGSMDSIDFNSAFGIGSFEKLLANDPAACVDWMQEERQENDRAARMFDMISVIVGRHAQ